jgi:hypothetical protein
MLVPKHAQKLLPAVSVHLNDLLDEALEQTFPASDPIAINFEIESSEDGLATTPKFRAPLRSKR